MTDTPIPPTTLWILPPPSEGQGATLPPLLRPARSGRAAENALTLRLADGFDAAAAQEGALLLLHRSALCVIGASLGRGVAPAQALADWQAETETLIARNRRMRRRITLLDIEIARADPDATRKALSARLGRDLPQPEQGTAPPAPASTTDPMLRLAASALLASNPAARMLAAELEALSLMTEASGPDDPVTLVEKGMGHYLSGQTDDAGREVEQSLLRAQIQQLHANLEQHHAASAALRETETTARQEIAEIGAQQAAAEAALQDSRAEIDSHKTRIQSHEATIAKLRTELSELRRIAGQAGADRDRLAATLTEVEGDRDALRQEMDHAAAMLDQIYASRSWRITEPVRWARRVTLGAPR